MLISTNTRVRLNLPGQLEIVRQVSTIVASDSMTFQPEGRHHENKMIGFQGSNRPFGLGSGKRKAHIQFAPGKV